MAQVFGDRWEIIERIKGGGQGEVYRVKDRRSSPGEVFALKRVLNPKRRDRFLTEVSAVKKLKHKNIIELLDHSALDSETPEGNKQYLVMPLANSDLSDRVEICKGMLDITLAISLQAAEGLAYAHSQGVIHRDVKPANFLFLEQDNRVLIADFGICLLRDAPRLTETGEVVGPRNFMAPEMEGGGQLEVSPAVDVYSLGKVIFYLFTGGKFLPRENIFQDAFTEHFSGGQQHHLLRNLLARMVVESPSQRINMDEVIEQLKHIVEWKAVATAPMGVEALTKLHELTSTVIATQREQSRSMSAQNRATQSIENIKVPFSNWLGGLLEEGCRRINLSGVINAKIEETAEEHARKTLGKHLLPLAFVTGMELHVQIAQTPLCHVLQFMLCSDYSNKDRSILLFFPAYRRFTSKTDIRYGFVNSKSWAKSKKGPHDEINTHVSDTPKMSAPQIRFEPSEFLQKLTDLRLVYDESLFVFLEQVEKAPYTIGR